MDTTFVEVTEQKRDELRKLLHKADDEFKKFLGITDNLTRELVLMMNPDKYQKYWLIENESSHAIGIFYIYDYDEKYKKCSLGYGLLKNYRGIGLSESLIDRFCTYLEDELGIIRIEAAVELENTHCLNLMEHSKGNMGFKLEGMAMNYWGKGVDCNIYSRVKR